MNLKDIFTEYARRQRKLCAEAYKNNIGSEHYFDSTYDPIKNAPEPPLPEIPVMRWVKASEGLPGESNEVYLRGCRVPKGYLKKVKEYGRWYIQLFYQNPWGELAMVSQWIKGHEQLGEIEWLFDPSQADLYMILPGVEKESKK